MWTGNSGEPSEKGLSEERTREADGVIEYIACVMADRKGRVMICGHSGDLSAGFLARKGFDVYRVRPGNRGELNGLLAGVARGSGSLTSANPAMNADSIFEAVIVLLNHDEYVALPSAFFARLRQLVHPGGLIGIIVCSSDIGNPGPDRTPLLVEFEGFSIEYARTASEPKNEWSVIFRKPMSHA